MTTNCPGPRSWRLEQVGGLLRATESRQVVILLYEMLSGSDGVRVLLSGEIDMAVRDDLRSVLHRAIAASPAVVDLDLDEVAFLDCSGISEFVRAYQDARHAGRRLIVTRPQGITRKVLELTNVLPLLAPDLRPWCPETVETA